ncbi:hypothetical protein A5713_24685 [Mycobacterium sp. E2497]|nr:hypothetical protein A5713_24685 [Mycobacterium sp. E2497]
MPSITLNFLPMSHGAARVALYGTLANGGTAYFAAEQDLSTLLEDLALTRPTQLSLVPRVWEMLRDEYAVRLGNRSSEPSQETTHDSTLAELRTELTGGRVLAATTGSAPLARTLKEWVQEFLDIPLIEGYGSTETGAISLDGRILCPPVSDYKLVDVPELGYFTTDTPHPRGELVVKSANLFNGYYRRPDVTAQVFDEDGFYHTGDIFSQIEPDRLAYVDRRNNVLKLSQGEFVTVSKLEAIYAEHPRIQNVYVYGSSAHAYLLAVVVPTTETLGRHTGPQLRAELTAALRQAAREAELQSYEIPRDFIIDEEPFTLENGLLTGIHKLARPKLKDRYGGRLDALYDSLERQQAERLRTLRAGSIDGSTVDTVTCAAATLLGAASSDLSPDAHFIDLGGDSLSALTFANLLQEIFSITVPVGVITSPATDLHAIADYIDSERAVGGRQPTPAAVHGAGATEIRADQLTLDQFIDKPTLMAASRLPRSSSHPRTVLITGATGFLGRYLMLDWLERMSLIDGQVICLVRARNDVEARIRLDRILADCDSALGAKFRRLAAHHLHTVAADKAKPNLGLDNDTWRRLAGTVDLIVDAGALVNHLLPYDQLFGPNVVGTAELIRLALTTKVKSVAYVSTIGIAEAITEATLDETSDLRRINTLRALHTNYANGYTNSKWAAEILLREAHERCGLPASIFRCGMILAEPRYAGQLNLPDMFTRLILSILSTGIAPKSFYEADINGNRQRAHYDGLPVDFVAEAISSLGRDVALNPKPAFETYHVTNTHDDGIGLDQYVDWLIAAGHRITLIDSYPDWLARFETALRALPELQRQSSLLPMLGVYSQPARAHGAVIPADRFQAAVRAGKIGSHADIPQVTSPVILKYASDLGRLGLI